MNKKFWSGPGARYPLIWVRAASGPWALSRACPETQAVLFSAQTVVIGQFVLPVFNDRHGMTRTGAVAFRVRLMRSLQSACLMTIASAGLEIARGLAFGLVAWASSTKPVSCPACAPNLQCPSEYPAPSEVSLTCNPGESWHLVYAGLLVIIGFGSGYLLGRFSAPSRHDAAVGAPNAVPHPAPVPGTPAGPSLPRGISPTGVSR